MDYLKLEARSTPGAQAAERGDGAWRLSIPASAAGPAGRYRWAQVDDYQRRPRRSFLWQAPVDLSLRARVSAPDLPGTWGFGLWNDPFSAGLGLGGMAARIPALPNAAWFFYASAPNHLALRDTHPAQGLLAATFRAPRIPSALLALGLPAAGLLAVPAAARLIRRLAARVVGEDAAGLSLDATEWHTYRLRWEQAACQFWVDDAMVFETQASPCGKLGLVLWIDNQFAAFPADGRLRFGTLPGPAAWLDLEILKISSVRV